MDEKAELWRHQRRDGLARIVARRVSNGRGRGGGHRKATKRVVEFYSSDGRYRAQTNIGASLCNILMALKPGNRSMWVRKIALDKTQKEAFIAWVQDGIDRATPLAAHNEFSDAEVFGVQAIFPGGLPSLGKRR